MKTISPPAIALFLCLATSAFSQNYPLPGAVWEPAVLCTGCTGQNATGQLNDGLPTSPYGAPFVAHVGRVVDSTEVSDFQDGSGFATARARVARVVRQQHGNVPPRVYLQVGNAIAIYSLADFFTAGLPGGIVPISTAAGYNVNRGASPAEKVLKWDAWIYPPRPGSGWEITVTDGQDKLSDFDIDDRGIVYVATGGNYGWGLVQDSGQTGGVLLPLITNAQVTDYQFGGLNPDRVVAVKAGSNYYAVISAFDGGRHSYNVTSTSSITSVSLKTGVAYGFQSFARDDVRERIAIVTLERKIEIYDNATFVSGGVPLASFLAPAGKYYRDVTVDEDGNFWTSEASNTPSDNKIVKLQRGAGGYTQATYDVYGEAFTPAPGTSESLSTINYGDGYLTVAGRRGAGTSSRDSDVVIFKIEAGAPVLVSAGGFFGKYYHKAPSGYAQPRANTNRTMGAYPIRWNEKLYLLYNVQGLGDVFQFDDGRPVISSLTPLTGPPSGGTTVTVYGANFGNTPTLTIGGSVVGSILVTPNRLDAQTPSHAPMVVDVIVSAGLDSSSAKKFTYALSAPQNFIAAAVTTTSVMSSWSSVAGATQYEVQRRQPDLSWLAVGTTTDLSFTESSLAPVTSYFYRVRALDASAYASSPSPSDFATTAAFAGQAIVPGMSIQAVHINDLRAAINALRAAAGMSAASFGETVSEGTTIRAQHFTELRTAVAQARAAIAASSVVFTDSSLTSLPVKAIHMQELMDAVK